MQFEKSEADAKKQEEEEEEEDDALELFGDGIPFSDPMYYQQWSSPYYNASHRRLRKYMRDFTEEYIIPEVDDWDAARILPEEFMRKAGSMGILASVAGNAWPTEWAKGIPVPGDVKPEEWDAFHSFIVTDELCRCASGGVIWGMMGGLGIGLPPILNFASQEMKARVVPPCLRGEKRICLAITEPSAGSDVANLTTTAKKTEDGKHYIVNGEKKWITNGIWSDFFTVAVRTGGKGMGGISLLLIEKDMPGVVTRRMDVMGVLSSGTSYITFEDVKVPVENLIGKENKGFNLIMSNFNGERIGIAIQANRFARVCLEESIKYASKRETFGVKLIDHPVIRNKIAHMARQVEATHSWMEMLIYQTTQTSHEEYTMRGGGFVALLKAQATITFAYCAAEAMQIFGGIGYTKGGQGGIIERLYREVRAYTIPGGSEEIMLDLGVRQQIKIAQIQGAKL